MRVFILISMLLGFSFAAQAERQGVEFFFSSHYSYYACSYAESQTESHLRSLKATQIRTRCSGGIQPGPDSFWMPINVYASYLPAQVSEPVTVTIRGNESCDFNVRLIKTLVRRLGYKTLQSRDSCWDSRGSYSFQIRVE